ncbi:unnamed protein product [Closterium sp. Naga37s-1]|nr:unnamed protein product [Closterium sp. Naga37s-1]
MLRVCSRHPRRQADAVLPALSRLLDLQARLTAARAPLGGALRAEGETQGTERAEGTECAEESGGGGGGRGEAGREGGGGAAAGETSLAAAAAAPLAAPLTAPLAAAAAAAAAAPPPELLPWQQLEEQLSMDEPDKSLATREPGEEEGREQVQVGAGQVSGQAQEETVEGGRFRLRGICFPKGWGGEEVSGGKFTPSGARPPPSPSSPANKQHGRAASQFLFDDPMLIEYNASLSARASSPLGSGRASGAGSEGGAAGGGGGVGVSGGPGPSLLSPMGGGTGSSLLSPVGCSTPQSTLSDAVLTATASSSTNTSSSSIAAVSGPLESLFIGSDVTGAAGAAGAAAAGTGGGGGISESRSVDGVSSIGVIEGGGGVMKSRSATQPTLQNSSSFPVQENKFGIISSNSLSLHRSAAASAVGDGDSTAPPPRITIPPVYSDGSGKARQATVESASMKEYTAEETQAMAKARQATEASAVESVSMKEYTAEETQAMAWTELEPLIKLWIRDTSILCAAPGRGGRGPGMGGRKGVGRGSQWGHVFLERVLSEAAMKLRVFFFSEHQLIKGVSDSTPFHSHPLRHPPSPSLTLPYPPLPPLALFASPHQLRVLFFSEHQLITGVLDASPPTSNSSSTLPPLLSLAPLAFQPYAPPPPAASVPDSASDLLLHPGPMCETPDETPEPVPEELKANDSTTHSLPNSTSQSTPENTPEGAPENTPENPPENTPESSSKRMEQVARKPGEHLMSPDSVFRHLVGSVGGVKSTLCALCANAAAIAASKSAPEKIFTLLEAYRTVADLSPQALPVFLALPKSDSDDPFKLCSASHISAPPSSSPLHPFPSCSRPFPCSSLSPRVTPILSTSGSASRSSLPEPSLPLWTISTPSLNHSISSLPLPFFLRLPLPSSSHVHSSPSPPQALPVFLALPKSDSDDPFKLWQRLSQLFAGAIFATLDDLNRILRDVAAFVPANQASGSSPMKKKLLRLIHWKSSEQKTTNDEEVDIGVHKVTSYVINFIAQLMDRESRADHYGTLEMVYKRHAADKRLIGLATIGGASFRERGAGGGSGGGKAGGSSGGSKTGGSKLGAVHSGQRGHSSRGMQGSQGSQGSQSSQSGGQSGGQTSQGGGQASQGGNQLQHPSAGGRRQLAAEMEGLLDSLLFNMEARGRAIQDPAMGALFVMNNAHYVAGSIVTTRMKDALKQQDRIAAYEAAFDKAGLAKLMACLAPEEVSAKLSADAVKSRLKKFNSAFEEVALEQNRWIVISDSQRKKTRIRFARTLKNAYLEFLTPHR